MLYCITSSLSFYSIRWRPFIECRCLALLCVQPRADRWCWWWCTTLHCETTTTVKWAAAALRVYSTTRRSLCDVSYRCIATCTETRSCTKKNVNRVRSNLYSLKVHSQVLQMRGVSFSDAAVYFCRLVLWIDVGFQELAWNFPGWLAQCIRSKQQALDTVCFWCYTAVR